MKRLKVILLCSLIVFSYVFYIIINDKYGSYYIGYEEVIIGRVESIKKYDSRYTFIVSDKEKVLVNYYGDDELSLVLGDVVRLYGKLNKPRDNSVFYLFNYRKYLLSKKIKWTFTLDKLEVVGLKKNIFYDLKNNIYNRINSFNNAYVNAFLVGDNAIDTDVYESYQINGISHLLAISGSHVTVLSIMLLFVLNRFIKKRNINILLVIIFFAYYLFLTNFAASIVRSVLMFIGISIKKVFKFSISSFEILYIIFLLLLLYNPFFVYDLGFNFSFVVSFYLIGFSNVINKFNNYFIKLFMISFIAFLASMPILINSSFCINLLSPFLNVLFVPLVTFILFPLSMLVFIFPFLINIFNICINLFECLSLSFANISLEVSFSYIPIYIVVLYYAIITYILIGIKKGFYKRILILLFVMVIHYNINYFNFYPIITFIDVGQGDAHLIILPHNKGNILIDTGGSDYDLTNNVLVPYLRASGVKNIDYLILTHGDYDHMGNSKSLVENFKVSNVIFNSYSDNDLEKELISLLDKSNISYNRFNKNKLVINDYIFNFINGIHNNENNDSLIVYTSLNDWNILFMGDATAREEEVLIKEYNLEGVDILKIGHHGSKTSTSEKFLSTIDPMIGVIPVASKNLYGHPNEKVMTLLDDYDIDVYLTSINGSIKFVLKGDLVIETCY